MAEASKNEAPKVQIQCPNCGTPFQTPIISLIDVGHHPELRRLFLASQLNVAQCPNCKQASLLDVPLLYHDPGAEFLAVYFPGQLNLPEMERQRAIGEMTQSLMRSLPPEQRKGYFLNPRQYLNRQSLMDAILGTMGISQEELDRQRKKMKLLDQALVMVDDRKGLDMLVKAQDSQMDHEFFLILANAIEQSAGAGDEAGGKKLLDLREKLIKLTSWGKQAAKQQEAVASLEDAKSPEDVLERVLKADMDSLDAMVLAARPLMDYSFFQMLSERINAASGAERDRLTNVRERLLSATQEVDEMAKEAIEDASDLLNQLMAAPDPRMAVREHVAEIDNTFMSVLAANLQEAEHRGAREVADRLQAIWTEILGLAEEGLPPEVRLINELLRAAYPDDTRRMLQARKGEISSEFLALMDQLAEDLAERKDTEAAKRLRDIKTQAMLLV